MGTRSVPKYNPASNYDSNQQATVHATSTGTAYDTQKEADKAVKNREKEIKNAKIRAKSAQDNLDLLKMSSAGGAGGITDDDINKYMSMIEKEVKNLKALGVTDAEIDEAFKDLGDWQNYKEKGPAASGQVQTGQTIFNNKKIQNAIEKYNSDSGTAAGLIDDLRALGLNDATIRQTIQDNNLHGEKLDAWVNGVNENMKDAINNGKTAADSVAATKVETPKEDKSSSSSSSQPAQVEKTDFNALKEKSKAAADAARNSDNNPPEEEKPSESVEVEAERKADDIADKIGADKEQTRQINKATKGIFSAIADGSLSPEAGSYFLMDAIMKTANNAQRRDANYINNLSRAVHGDTILAYDINNDEKSKYEEMVQNPALERANKAAAIESESNAQTSANLSSLKQEQDYGEQAGTQGLATSAAVNQAQSGQFDPLVAAYATGDENKVQEAINAQLKDPVIQTRLSELEKQLKEATFDADVYAANLANQMSEEQIQMLKQQARLLGFEGDVKSVLSNVIRGIQGGNLDLGDVASLLLITGLNKL